MDLETTQKLTNLQRRLDAQELPERPTDLISSSLAFTGQRGFWPMSAFSAIGDAFDQSGNGRTLTYNGNPTYNYDGLVPYIDFDGTGDFLSRADEAGLDITGTETFVASAVRGLTLGGWFWFDATPGAQRTMISKFGASGNFSYRVRRLGTTEANIEISVDGTALVSCSSVATMTTSQWYFVVGRFDPSTELATFVNGVKEICTIGIPASIFNGNGPFQISGINGATQIYDGRASLCFLCAAALSDTIIDAAFQATRAAFGV